ncbi:hypothetical protein [Phenylobacterium montanum]|uniref:Uncharacterized protein n=1 Tax=Phenylobacterium montanum TaxID=2823693 RepID=A0A975FXK7_9CAUL|nr:hypothetical protein [Caulobacter sp. S6]QUD87145.1 hypothetical protein KCG34_19095 [Caulobacter sp. S6]
MDLPIDPDLTPIPDAGPAPLDIDEAIECLTQTVVVDTTIYTQIAQRRSQLEDAETLRRARAL